MDIFTLLVKFLICSFIFEHDDLVDVFVLSHVGLLLVDHLLGLLKLKFSILMC